MLGGKITRSCRKYWLALQFVRQVADAWGMKPRLALVQGGLSLNTVRDTERFLLNQPEVLDASVWRAEGRLMAHVTLFEGSAWTEQSLRSTCAQALGLEYTPSEVILMNARLRVA